MAAKIVREIESESISLPTIDIGITLLVAMYTSRGRGGEKVEK